MASGEGTERAIQWQKSILKGDFLTVVKCWKKDQGALSLSTVVTVLSSSCTFITNSQKDKTNVLSDIEGLTQLTEFSCQFAAEAENFASKQNGKDLFKKTLWSIHFNMYTLYTMNYFEEVGRICKSVPTLANRLNNVNDVERKEMLRKTFLELGSIAWNSAFKLQDPHGCPKIDLCLFAFELIVRVDAIQTSTTCDRLIRALITCGKSLPCLKDLLKSLTKSCEPLMDSVLQIDSFKKQLEATVKALIDEIDLVAPYSDIKSGLESVGKLFPPSYLPRIQKITKPYLVFCSINSNTCRKEDLDELKSMIQDEDSDTEVNIIYNLVAVKKLFKWQNVPPECVTTMQELCHACLISLSKEKKLDLVSQILIMSNAHIPKTKKPDGWIDTCSSALFWTIEALELVKNDLAANNIDHFEYRTKLLHNIVVVSWNFYQTANCCYEAYFLNKYFLKHAFKLAEVQNLDEKKFDRLMNTLTQGTKFISKSLVSGRPGREKEMAKEALKAGVKLLSCAALCMKFSSKRACEKIISSAMKAWCEIRILTSKVLDNKSASVSDLLKLFGLAIESEALEILLCYEIEAFSQERDSEGFVKVSGEALESLDKKSNHSDQQQKTKLAISLAKSKSDNALDVEASFRLAQEVSDSLQKEVKKSAHLDKLALLVLALHQEFLSNLKAMRLKNKELGDVPLTVRSQRNTSEDEQKTCEEWENAVELSQLGQILSCRQESKDFRPLSLIMGYCTEILKLKITSDDTLILEPVLQALECSGLHFTIAGHEWCAIKSWNCLYLLASLMEYPHCQLRALGWLIQKYNMELDGKLLDWVLKKKSTLVERINSSDSIPQLDATFSMHFFDICLAQCYANSGKPIEAAHIVLRLRKEIDHNKYFIYTELMCRTFLVASQVLGSLSGSNPLSKELTDAFIDNMAAANWAFKWTISFVSTTKPAERDLLDLRLIELMISSGLLISSLSNMSCNYKTSCSTLQMMLHKIQKLHLSTRVAQLLSLLGDLDMLIPDTVQVQQRLFWNQKILNLGSAIVGEGTPKIRKDVSPSSTPSKMTRKEHQLTASCSIKCQGNSGCTLCKNPLYQICKAHYLFLSSTNKEAFWTLFSELEKANTIRSERLASLAWSSIASVSNKMGWMQMLQGPLDLLKHRQVLANAARKASKGEIVEETLSAMRDVLVCKEQLKKLTMPIARYLENWAVAEEIAIGIQLIGAGPWDPKLQKKCYSLAPEYNSEEETSRPCSPAPNIVIPIKPPKPQRKGRRALVDEPVYIAPPNPPKITIIDLSEESPTKDELGEVSAEERIASKRNLLKTCKKPQIERMKENSGPQLDDDSPVLPSRSSKRQLMKPPAATSTSKTPPITNSKKAFMTAVKKPPSKFSSSSNDSPEVAKQPAKKTAIRAAKPKATTKLDSPASSSDEVAIKRRVRKISTSSADSDSIFNARTRRK